MADASFQFEELVKRPGRQRLQLRLLGSEGLADNPACCAMETHVGNRREPVGKLGVEVVKVAERPGQEEVLPDVAERPLHFTLGLSPIGPTSSRSEPVVAAQCDQ